MNKTGIIYGVNGPVIYLKGDPGFKISEMVYVGPEKLVGEVIGLKKGMTTVQAMLFPFFWDLESFITFSMVSSVLWRRLQNPPENIFPVVSVLIPLILLRNGMFM